MSFGSGFAIYFIIWWVTLFTVLPIGVKTQQEEGDVVPGSEPSAPAQHMLGRKLVANSVLAGIVFGIYWLLTGPLGYGFDSIPSIFPDNLGG